MNAKENQKLLATDDLVGRIHDSLLDLSDLNLADAFNAACVEIASLYREIERLERTASFGYLRKKQD